MLDIICIFFRCLPLCFHKWRGFYLIEDYERQTFYFRHNAPRRRTGAGLSVKHRGENRGGPPVRAIGRRHYRSRIPHLESGRLQFRDRNFKSRDLAHHLCPDTSQGERHRLCLRGPEVCQAQKNTHRHRHERLPHQV